MQKKTGDSAQVALEVEHISKEFPGVKALDDVSFFVRKGEVLGLVGQNGAGKSTIIQIVSGAYIKDEGTIKVDGEPVNIISPRSSLAAGIAVVYQKLQLIDTMTVAENICIYEQVEKFKSIIDYRKVDEIATQVLTDVGVNIPIHTLVGDLSPGRKQFVEIAKALSSGAKILILDEPTASLTDDEVKQLFAVLRRLKSTGVAIIYVSHRFDEIFEICDRVTVLRNGKHIQTTATKDLTGSDLVSLVIGKSLHRQFPERKEKEIGEVILEFKNVTSAHTERIKDISFSLRKGQILGIYGLQYSGLQEIADIICGSVKQEQGNVIYLGKSMEFKAPYDAISHGIAYLTNDRLLKGTFPVMTLRENLTASSIRKYLAFGGVIKQQPEKDSTDEYIKRLNIMTTSREKQMQFLSGGNQQKVLVCRLLDTDAKILVLHEPTHGIDVGSKSEMYTIMLNLASQGYSIIFLSTEMEEIISLSDEIIVLNKGRAHKSLKPEETDIKSLHSLASL
jgi:ABC-type sugar transport system ATPase subunit